LNLVEQGSSGLKKLLLYMTSLDRIPPLGMRRKIAVEFVAENRRTFFAETCLLNLQVPTIHCTYHEFKKAFHQAVEHNTGFGST
jgi:hypothetical protein